MFFSFRCVRGVAAMCVPVAAIMALSTAPAAAQTKIAITNPSFLQPSVKDGGNSYISVGTRNDAIPGWRVTEGGVDVLSRDSADTRNRSQALDLNGAGTDPGTIEQKIRTDGMGMVTVQFRAKLNNAHSFCRDNSRARATQQEFVVRFAGNRDTRFFSLGSLNEPASSSYTDWQNFRAEFHPSGDFSRLQFASKTPNAHCGPVITDIRATQT